MGMVGQSSRIERVVESVCGIWCGFMRERAMGADLETASIDELVERDADITGTRIRRTLR